MQGVSQRETYKRLVFVVVEETLQIVLKGGGGGGHKGCKSMPVVLPGAGGGGRGGVASMGLCTKKGTQDCSVCKNQGDFTFPGGSFQQTGGGGGGLRMGMRVTLLLTIFLIQAQTLGRGGASSQQHRPVETPPPGP